MEEEPQPMQTINNDTVQQLKDDNYYLQDFYICTAISFLNSRLLQPNEDDYKKLIRVMKYLDSSVDMPLVLSGDDNGQIRWWIDASFAVHNDMKSHTRATLLMGKGAVYSTSGKQKHVTRSSTEAEIVAVHDVMLQLIWTGYFLDAQGFTIKDTTLYQEMVDNPVPNEHAT